MGDIKYNADNKYIYLSLPSRSNNSILVVDTLSNKIITRITDVGKDPSDIDYNPVNKFIYVTNRDNKSVSVINSSSNKVIKNITGVGANLSDIVYNPDNKLLYIINFEMIHTNPSHERDPIIFLINSSSNEVIKNITGVGAKSIRYCL